MEEKKKGSDIKTFLLLFVLVIVVAVFAFIYLYQPLAEERDALMLENYNLEFRLIELRNLATDHEQEYKDGINASKNSIQTVLNHYSAGNTPEKSIMMSNTLETEVGIRVPLLNFSQPTLVSTVRMPLISDTEDGGYTVGYYDVSLLKETLSTNYTCDYAQLKKLINFINVYPERMNIENITMGYNNETGQLQGSLTLNLYAVTGTGKEYIAPDISGLSMGINNIFGE